MINKIRTSKTSKIIASYLAIQLLITTIQPTNLYALTSGPSQPEFNSFTPIGTSDMVGLTSGDFNYNIPIMDVGGYPLNLAYDSGITMDQEASWVGLGWNLNVGQINRQVRGLPDDFNGDIMTYENNLKDNITFGADFAIATPLFGTEFLSFNGNIGIQYNNYNGFTVTSGFGPSFDIGESVQAGFNISGSGGDKAAFTPSISIKSKLNDNVKSSRNGLSGKLGLSLPFTSTQGLTGVNINASLSKPYQQREAKKRKSDKKKSSISDSDTFSTSGSLSFNDNLSYSPGSDLSFFSSNFSVGLGLGTEIWGAEVPQANVTGFGNIQILADKVRSKRAFGYDNRENANITSVLDFNRENEATITARTKVLAMASQTPDVYSIKGQGIGGMFRSYRNQSTFVYDALNSSQGIGGSFGGEIGAATGVHVGFDYRLSPSYSSSSVWSSGNNAISPLTLNNQNNKNDYEPTYFKMVGEFNLDREYEDLFINKLYGNSPMKFNIEGSKFKRRIDGFYRVKQYASNGAINYINKSVTTAKRQNRIMRSQEVQMIKKIDVLNNEDPLINITNPDLVKNNHYVASKVYKADGSLYVYGESSYNTKKEEVNFAVSRNNSVSDSYGAGLVGYSPNLDNSLGNGRGRDHYYSNTITPAYAHTYLLTSVHSSDYQDLTNNGPTDDDLGAYTKFTYTSPTKYSWRFPFEQNMATFSTGLRTDNLDDKASYIYGEKQMKYAKLIETKTHVAYISLSDRMDAIGVVGKNGGPGAGRMKKIDKIYLFSKPEFEKFRSRLENDDVSDDPSFQQLSALAIKVAHFDYTYNLCRGIPNSLNGEGKLTLKKVFFTYRGSNMGKYTPYVFNYNEDSSVENPSYYAKNVDVWSNYKKTIAGVSENGNTSNTEFPFVDQENPNKDVDAAVWNLKSIKLPSGGTIEVEFESDDYQYVQDKRPMRMFKLSGIGDNINEYNGRNLYIGGDDKDYLFVEVPNGTTSEDFRNNYLRDIGSSEAFPMYFKVMMNMTDSYDYVPGYAMIDKEGSTSQEAPDGKWYGVIKLKRVKREGGLINSNQNVNPLAKSGWSFGRKYLNRQVFDLGGPEVDNLANIVSLVKGVLTNAVGAVGTLITGPNQKLRNKGCASVIIPEKSYIRLYEPDNVKTGGGLRVRNIKMYDNWDVMNNVPEDLKKEYSNFYGQEYSYTLEEDNTSSGVATFEPNGSVENPLIQPIFNGKEKLSERSYVEKPFGKSLYPSPEVTYSRVTVKNLSREQNIGDNIVQIKKHATGEVVSEFYTTRDFPTKTDYTDITGFPDNSGILGSFLKVRTQKKLTYSQGFMVETNDMNGKPKNQKVRSENQTGSEYLSEVHYLYSQDIKGNLDNNLDIINPDGTVEKKELGVTYDVVSDFRKDTSSSQTVGMNFNLANLFVVLGIIPVPVPLPVVQTHTSELKIATNTKIIHKTGILKQTIARDLGSEVSTENIAWDSNTGQVLVTETTDEYNQNYYSLNLPSYWYYVNMGFASKNLGVSGELVFDNGFKITNLYTNNIVSGANGITVGDELLVEDYSVTDHINRLWVVEVTGDVITLMDSSGYILTASDLAENTAFKVYKSGYDNLHASSMASVTLSKMPLVDTNGDNNYDRLTTLADWEPLKVINSSAVEYSDLWDSQCEFQLPKPLNLPEGQVIDYNSIGFNPYLYNVKGNWRAIKSYAYLTSRNNGEQNFSTRNEGFFNSFKPFYKYNGSTWEIDNDPNDSQNYWTFASQVTKYSPYGAELENRDALNRYSAAQYGYRYTLPTAVGSNTEYRELGFDGFEDYDYSPINGSTQPINSHFGFQDEVLTNSQAEITSQESHSGRNSISVRPGGTAAIIHRLIDCEDELILNDDVFVVCNSGPGAVQYDADVLFNDNLDNIDPLLYTLEIISQPTCTASAIVVTNNTQTILDDYISLVSATGLEGCSFTYQICSQENECITATVNFPFCDNNSKN